MRRESVEAIAITVTMLAEALSERDGYLDQMNRLQIIAHITGVVSNLQDGVLHDNWLMNSTQLCMILGGETAHIEGYVKKADIPYLPESSVGRFVAESGEFPAIDCVLEEVDPTAHEYLLNSELASTYVGDIAVLSSPGDGIGAKLAETRYFALFSTTKKESPMHRIRGYVVLSGYRQSLIMRGWKSIAPGLIQEHCL